MGETTTPTLGSRVRGAAVILALAVGLPIAAVLPFGDPALLSPATLVAAFSLVHSLNAGWRRSVVLVALLVAGTLVGALTAGTPLWPWFVAALGVLVGLATRVGRVATAVIAGFVSVGVPATDGGVPWLRLAVVAVVGLYAVAVARALGLPATIPGRRLAWAQVLPTALVCGLATGAAAVLAQASGDPRAAWAPATLLLLMLPSADLSLPRRAANRVAGTLLGAAAAVVLGGTAGAAAVLLAAGALFLCLVFTRPVWVSVTLSTVAVVLLLDTGGGHAAAEARVAAVVGAAAFAVVGAGLLSVLGRRLPASAAGRGRRGVARAASGAGDRPPSLRPQQLLVARHPDDGDRLSGELLVEGDEGVRLQPGERHVLRRQGVGPAQVVGHVPRHVEEHPVAEHPDPQAADVVQPALGVLPGELTGPHVPVEPGDELGPDEGGSDQLHALAGPHPGAAELQRDGGVDDVASHGTSLLGHACRPLHRTPHRPATAARRSPSAAAPGRHRAAEKLAGPPPTFKSRTSG